MLQIKQTKILTLVVGLMLTLSASITMAQEPGKSLGSQAPASELQIDDGAGNETQSLLQNQPSVDDVFGLKKLSEVNIDIHSSAKRKPESTFSKLPNGSVVQPAQTVYMWESPAIRHQPLFFEDPTLERYGQDAGLLQPAVSGAHFFGRVLTLPLHATVKSPFSCDYPLGYLRPGNCNPYLHHRFPW